MKKVFIVSQFFPPVNMIGAVRPYQMANYFARLGFDVTVFCSYDDGDEPKNYEVDLSKIKVISIKKSSLIKYSSARAGMGFFEMWLKRLLRKLSYPDHFRYSIPKYFSEMDQEIAKNGVPDLMVSSALPFSVHCAARLVKSKFPEIKWVADFRDLWAMSEYRVTLSFLRGFDRNLENSILRDADLITVVTEHMKNDMSHYIESPERIEVITNGADETLDVDFSDACSDIKDSYEFIYTGILYGGYRDTKPLLDALNQMELKSTMKFYGAERTVVYKLMEAYSGVDIQYFPSVSKSEIKKLQNKTDFLIVALGSKPYEKGVLPGKFFEYIESRKPIIALCDEDSEIANIINKHNLGVATRNFERIKEYISQKVLDGNHYLPPPHEELTRKFQLSKILKNI